MFQGGFSVAASIMQESYQICTPWSSMKKNNIANVKLNMSYDNEQEVLLNDVIIFLNSH